MALLVALLLALVSGFVPLTAAAALAAGPVPPCVPGQSVAPSYPPAGAPPVTRIWFADALDGSWTPPPCTGWQGDTLVTLVATAARFRHQGGTEALLRRLAETTALTSIQYWLVGHQQWATLFNEAYALKAPRRDAGRANLSLQEMQPGSNFYLWLNERTKLGDGVYRLRILERSPDRLVFGLENVDDRRYLLVNHIAPGELQFLYFLERETGDLWRFYSLMRTQGGSSFLASHHESAFVTRAVAMYRYFAGIPTDIKPPKTP